MMQYAYLKKNVTEIFFLHKGVSCATNVYDIYTNNCHTRVSVTKEQQHPDVSCIIHSTYMFETCNRF